MTASDCDRCGAPCARVKIIHHDTDPPRQLCGACSKLLRLLLASKRADGPEAIGGPLRQTAIASDLVPSTRLFV
jgi:hypothetical protein